MKQSKALSMLEKTYITILLIIFGGIVLHAPLSVGLGVLFPNYSLLIKSWKEILMLIAGIILIFLLYKKKQFKLLKDPIIIAIGVYALLHVITAMIVSENLNISSVVAGYAIDLRYALFFGLVYLAVKLYPNYYKMFIKVAIVGALIVLIFAILQTFVLPRDILKYIGYSTDTISPFLTVDQNPNFIRINSTLRGPNPLGAYAIIVLSVIVAMMAKCKLAKDKQSKILVGILGVGGLVALWSSYSRSAFIGMFVSVAIILFVTKLHSLSVKKWIIIGVAILSVIGVFILARDSSFVSNIILHDNPNSKSTIDSNEGHLNSIQEGLSLVVLQPLGAGVGSTGSASLYGDNPLIIENQYLFIAHEIGWLGLLLFVSIFVTVIIKLWANRKDWLVLGVVASGVGIAVIGMLLPVWVDDTVSIVWWGLAAVLLGSYQMYDQKNKAA